MSQDPRPPKKLDKIKSGLFSRGVTLAKIGLGASARMTGRSVAQLWEDKELRGEKWKSLFQQQAQIFSKEIGELKGSLMKAGQMLSMYGEHFFPPEVNQFLKSLQNESPPVKWEAIEEILQDQLGAEKLKQLEIEKESLASASLGQVHKARVNETQQTLALKIQYPGVEQAIESDLKAIRTFLGLMKVLPKDFDSRPIFEEVRSMLQQETDYELEANLTERYAELLGNDDRYVVPRVFREFSNRRVLATSFESGVRADDPLVQNLSQERRNRLAQNFLDLYFKELFEIFMVQTDPHAGNYRVRLQPDGNDRLVLLDFGATREYPQEFLKSYKKMIQAAALDDSPGFRQAARELRLLQENDSPELQQTFEDFCFMLVEPFRTDHYNWKQTDLPERTTKKALEIIRGFQWRSPPQEILFLDRKTGGVFIMLSMLKAQIPARSLLLNYLDKE